MASANGEPMDSFRSQDHIDAIAQAVGSDSAEVLQTHISVVVIAGERVFKFKKCVELPFLDFSTIERRERACRDELRLNRRFAKDVYLDVASVRRDRNGALAVGSDSGELVDWCVVMRRLPQERMLDVLLAEDAVTASEIEELARRIARFHDSVRGDVTNEVRAAGAPERLLTAIRDNFTELRRDAPGVVPQELLGAVEDRVSSGLSDLERRLIERAEQGHVVEGHGDLHARNICMTDPPLAYDCLEFRLDLRAGDRATDLAFLLMDLRYRGHAPLERAARDAYVAESGDRGLRGVLAELVQYRAMVRAKVDAFGARDRRIGDEERERLSKGARRHLRLAAWSGIEGARAIVVLASGLPASGKSTVLLEAGREADWTIVRSDLIRKELFGSGSPADRLPAEAYSEDASRRTYDELVARAACAEGVVLVDANFRTRIQRQAAFQRLRRSGRVVVVARFDCDESVLRRRLRARAARPSVSDADESVLDRLSTQYEMPREDEGIPTFALDGGAPVDDSLDRLASELLRRIESVEPRE